MPARSGSGAPPDRNPKAASSASRCGAGNRSRPFSSGAQRVEPRERELHLELGAGRPQRAEPPRLIEAHSSSEVLPTPAPPWTTSPAAVFAAGALDDVAEDLHLVIARATPAKSACARACR
jgi:hypothetical protein